MSIFDSTQQIKVPQSVHNLSHSFNGTYYPGLIYPVLTTRVVPGDVFMIASTPDFRTQPMVSPLFTKVTVDFRYFYCRNLLLWKNFDEYITNKNRYNQGDTQIHVHPGVTFVGSKGTLQDFIYGAVDGGTIYEDLDSLPCRMYNMVYNEYYRAENVSNVAVVPLDDGFDNDTDFFLRNGCYKKDYFTSGFQYPQSGNPVTLDSRVFLDQIGAETGPIYKDLVGNLVTAGQARFVTHGDHTYLETAATGNAPTFYDPNGSLGVNIDIRELRNANAIQRFLERSAVNGNRYAEFMLAQFGVKTSDNSAFRPQYLGGGAVDLNVSPVEQTVGDNRQPLATQGGRGRVKGLVGCNHPYLFREYGWLMCLMVIRPQAIYAGGIQRQFINKDSRYDKYYFPMFQNIGMDEVSMAEIAYPNQNAQYRPDDVFNYNERYIDYKTIPNTVHGEFLDTMRSWVAVRNFAGQDDITYFNDQFLRVETKCLNDNMAVSGYPPFFGPIYHSIRARRPMQYRADYRL